MPQIEKAAPAEAIYLESSRAMEPPITAKLSAIEQIIIDFISTNNLQVDEIIASTALAPAEVLSSLMSLELKGIVKQHPGKFFTRNNQGYEPNS